MSDARIETAELVEQLADALRALKDAATKIDFARPGQLTADEGWALIYAGDAAVAAVAAFDARRADPFAENPMSQQLTDIYGAEG